MSKIEFIARYVSPAGAEIVGTAGHIRIIHTCGCILTQTAGRQDYAELCGKHTREFCNLPKEEQS